MAKLDQNIPPNWVIRLLKRLCPPALFEGIIADLLEQYDLNITKKGKAKANILFIYNTLLFLRPAIVLKNKLSFSKFNTPLIVNYFKIGIRQLKKQWSYSVINIMGLSIGLTCAALVMLYVDHELSYDNFHHDPENTYRISSKSNYSNDWFASLSLPYSEELMKKEIPEIVNIARLRKTQNKYLAFKNTRFPVGKVLLTDTDTELFDIFKFEFISGNSENALRNQHELVITESLANSFFGDENPLNQVMVYDTIDYIVTGVIKDVPSNSHLFFEMIATNREKMKQGGNAYTYVKLLPEANISQFESKVHELKPGADQWDIVKEIAIQPLQGIHLGSQYVFDLKPSGDIRYIYIFSVIGLLVLIISCTNYMNLSIAMYSGRNTEIAVRKVMGARKSGLASQFLIEAMVVCSSGFVITILTLYTVVPVLNNLVDINIVPQTIYDLQFLGILALVTFMTALISGLYPSIVLSRLHTLQLFKNNILKISGGINLRKVLVVFQFTLLIGLGCSAWFINNQLDYMMDKDLGFKQEGILKIKYSWGLDKFENYLTLKNNLLSHSEIISVTTGMIPGDEDYGYRFRGENPDIIYHDVISYGTDLDYFETLGIEGIEGDFFNLPNDKKADKTLLVNEALVKRLGYENPIGRSIFLYPGDEREIERVIGGIFKDINFFSLHQQVPPQFIFAYRKREYVGQNIMIRVNMKSLDKAKSIIKKSWDDIVPNEPIYLQFISDDIQRSYNQEQKLSKFSIYLSTIAIILAITGLVGLSAFMVGLRIKEIGVRKVLGASIQNIIFILSKEFIILVSIATLIAGTISYFSITNWLDAFAYKVIVNPLYFLFAGIIALVLALASVGYQSIKAAVANPVDSLRYE